VQSEACPVTIPLTDGEGWQVLRYRDIPMNRVDFSTRGLRIDVDQSAAPIVYPLLPATGVVRLTVRGRVDGDLRVSTQRQGTEGFDDYVFRAGLVLAGDRRLSFFGGMFAPEWVKRLHALSMPDQGISKVRFFNIGTDPDQIGQYRVHPDSDLFEEEVVAVPQADGTFELDVSLMPPMEAVAIWLSADGDDSGSVFTVLVEHITLWTASAERPRC
jgi:hypothetical protein